MKQILIHLTWALLVGVFLVSGTAFCTLQMAVGAAECCPAPNNGAGSVDLPPDDCSYNSVNDAPVIDEVNHKVDSSFAVDSFFDITRTTDSDGSETQGFKATLQLDMTGSGSGLVGFRRLINIPVDVVVHTGPRNPGDAVQSFPTEMLSLRGELLPGDPDFATLRIIAGSDFGLPSPGHTTLSRQGPPGSDFAVDSFFDITYKIEFVGAPGSVLEGLEGTTQGRVRVTTCPEDKPKSSEIKWLQPPDKTRTGIDIRIDRGPIDASTGPVDRKLADDFRCTQTGPITDVHFWGSWFRDPVPRGYIYRIHLSIHKDVPAEPNSPNIYSHPGELLWERDFDMNEFSETLVANIKPDYEWWWDVYSSKPANPQGDQNIYRYDIDIDPADAFIQEGTPDDPIVYWLDIYVLTEFGEFGWKTSEKHWNDDAVYEMFGGTNIPWSELIYPPEHPYKGKSIDMAFAITTKVPTDPTEACCLPNGVCADLTPAECKEKGGKSGGPGSVCLGDANGNGIDDACDDCNGNGIPDALDIDPTDPDGNGQVSRDCNGNGIPDECEPDCNGNGIPDECDIATGGTSVDLNQNGIPDECECRLEPVICRDGEQAVTISYAAGSPDLFAAPFEPASPDVQLANYITSCSSTGFLLQFDQIPGMGGIPANSWLGHTFTGLPGRIVAAKLEVRARASTNSWGSFNDHLSIVDTISGCAATAAWSRRFMQLPEAGGTWAPGQTATFCLDLAAMPTAGGPISVLGQLANGSLRMRVDDDTGIDYMILTIHVCPCKYRWRSVFPAGEDDLFALPFEAASPSTELVTAFPGYWRPFDQIVPNRKFGHTFTGLPGAIVAAQLELRMRAGTDIPTNDALYLEFLNPGFAWAKRISDVTGLAWNAGDEKKILLNLANLPASNAGVTNILGYLADGDLDVYIQDDTAVDYVILRVWTCCSRRTILLGDLNLDGIVSLPDAAIVAGNWLSTTP